MKIIGIDFEYSTKDDGSVDEVLCVSWGEPGGPVYEQWLGGIPSPRPCRDWYQDDTALMAWHAVAEIDCFNVLGWDVPRNWVDAMVEYKRSINGSWNDHQIGQAAAAKALKLETVSERVKKYWQMRASQGSPFTEAEKTQLQDYCSSDVLTMNRIWADILERGLLPNPKQALLRGMYVERAYRAERRGIPVNGDLLREMQYHWGHMKEPLIDEVDPDRTIWTKSSFTEKKFRGWLEDRAIEWPVLPTGKLKLDRETFRQMATQHQEVNPIRDLRVTLSELRLTDLDLRGNRVYAPFKTFRSATSRNQPPSSRFIFGPARWVRCLITPEPGRSLLYMDWKAQEVGIAAYLSQDPALISAYEDGDDLYLGIMRQWGMGPDEMEEDERKEARKKVKACVLGLQFGMGAATLAYRIKSTKGQARGLINAHKNQFAKFWEWSDNQVETTINRGYAETVFGWRWKFSITAKRNTAMNFPCQANGAEMMRIALIHAEDRGVSLLAPVHDGFLIECDEGKEEEAEELMLSCMNDASKAVLSGVVLQVDTDTILQGEKYGGDENKMYLDALSALQKAKDRHK